MKNKNAWTVIITRTILGGCFILFGFNEIHGLLGTQEISPEGAKLLAAFKETGYLLYTIKGIELFFGTCLIFGFFVPLANLLLFPIVINIFLFHAFLDVRGLVLALVMLACSLTIFWEYRRLFLFLIKYNMNINPNAFNDEEIIPKKSLDHKRPLAKGP